jgi:hypothetical protein
VDARWRWVVLGWSAGLGTAGVLAVVIVAVASWHAAPPVVRPTATLRAVVGRRLDPGTRAASLPTATLTVHTDGCGVIRTEVPPGVENLTWHIEDQDGFSVLDRNAQGETRYRYFRPGTYTVVLQAFAGGAYVPISNTVTITC